MLFRDFLLDDKRRAIGSNENFYSGLYVAEKEGKFYWSTDYDGDLWEEIPESLYREIMKFEKSLAYRD